MKKLNLKLALGIVCAIALCVMTSCTKKETTGRIQGIVTDVVTTEPIQGVNISLSPTGASTVTGSDGRYEFNNLTPGNYTVQGMKNGYESNTKNITITEGNVSSGDMMLRPATTGFRLNVDYIDFGANFSQMQFKIINSSSTQPLSWEISESLNWLTASPSTGNLQGGQETTVTLDIDRSLLEQSVSANITVRSPNHSVVLPISVTVAGNNSPQLHLSETSLDFGTSATSLAFYVQNTGPATTSLNWVCSNINVGWLTLNPMSGNTAGGNSTQVIATIDRSQITGIVSTSVTINGAGTSQTITFTATASGSGTAILQLSESSLDFGETASSMTFQVSNLGSDGTTLNWTISTPTVDWLSFNPMSGSTASGSGTLVTALIDRTKIHGPVSTTVTVNGSFNSAILNVSAAYVDNTLVISEGLFCFFNFDGTEITDYYGNYTGINAGAVISDDTPSGEGHSYQFNGESSYILVQDNIVPADNPFTINIWFKTNRNDQALIGSDDRFSGWSESALVFRDDSHIEYFSGDYVSWVTDGTIAPYMDNHWHMLTVTFNGTLGMIYIDGNLFETKSADNLAWGAQVNNSFFGVDKEEHGIDYGFYYGKLDNFRSYNRALNASEIQQLFNAKQ